MEPILRSKFKTNLFSLAAESRYIRKQEKKFPKGSYERRQLQEHRVVNVRQETRVTQLAYAFAKKMPYKQVEPKTHQPIDEYLINKILNKLRRKGVYTISNDDILQWLKE